MRAGRCFSFSVRFSARVQAEAYVSAAKRACEVGTRLGRVILVGDSHALMLKTVERKLRLPWSVFSEGLAATKNRARVRRGKRSLARF